MIRVFFSVDASWVLMRIEPSILSLLEVHAMKTKFISQVSHKLNLTFSMAICEYNDSISGKEAFPSVICDQWH